MVVIPQEVQVIADDIQSMRTRGAGRIARAAVKGLMVATSESRAKRIPKLLKDVAVAAQLLYETRPTAVSLPNGLRYFYTRLLSKGLDLASLHYPIMQSKPLGKSVHGL
jgi:ribose 1,5-bisphosphate isomerase